jgi:hypothetical protein
MQRLYASSEPMLSKVPHLQQEPQQIQQEQKQQQKTNSLLDSNPHKSKTHISLLKYALTVFIQKENSCPIACTHGLHLQGKEVISCITCQHAYTEKYFEAYAHSLHSKENLFPITCTCGLHSWENVHLITCIYMPTCIHKNCPTSCTHKHFINK